MTMNTRDAREWLKYDARTAFFVNAIQFINWERIEGDILEFGVSVGKSLGLLGVLLDENLALWQYSESACRDRRLFGLDTFSGLPDDDQIHPRWGRGSFATNYLQGHPTLGYGEPITPESIRALFRLCELREPELLVGLFSETLPELIPQKTSKAALVHIDSDLYPSAREALFGVEPILQDGALICFDDWFMYRGSPDKGEQRAFREFLEAHPHWQAVPYQTYSVFCSSFIMHRR
jgi:hypothetical protein